MNILLMLAALIGPDPEKRMNQVENLFYQVQQVAGEKSDSVSDEPVFDDEVFNDIFHFSADARIDASGTIKYDFRLNGRVSWSTLKFMLKELEASAPRTYGALMGRQKCVVPGQYFQPQRRLEPIPELTPERLEPIPELTPAPAAEEPEDVVKPKPKKRLSKEERLRKRAERIKKRLERLQKEKKE